MRKHKLHRTDISLLRKAFMLLGFCFLILLASCTGWSTRSLTIDNAEKVYVPYFKNDTFFRRIEQDLTRQVIQRIQDKPGLYLTDEESADIIINGRIIDYRLSPLSEDPRDEVLEGSATICVKIEITRTSDNELLREELLTDTAEYNRLLNETVDTTRDESFSTLSRRIVDLLEQGF